MSLPLSTQQTLLRDVEAALPHPSCQAHCGAIKVSPSDSPFTFGHLINCAGIAYTVYTGSYWLAGGFGTSEFLLLIGHGLVRKYGDLTKAIEKFRSASSVYERALTEQEESARMLSETVSSLQEDMEKFRTENESLQHMNEALHKNIDDLKGTAGGVSANVAVLKLRNAALQTKIEQLKTLIAELKQALDHFGEESRVLKQDLGQVGSIAVHLGEVGSGIEEAAKRFDGEMDADLQELAGLVLRVRNDSGEIHRALLQNNQELQQRIQALSLAVAQIDRLDDDLEAKTGPLSGIAQEVMRQAEELKSLKEGSESLVARLGQQRLLLQQEREALAKERSQFAQEMERWNQVQSGFAETAHSLAVSGEAIAAALRDLT